MVARKSQKRSKRKSRGRKRSKRRKRSRRKQRGGTAPLCPKEKCPCPDDHKRFGFKSKLHNKCAERRSLNPAQWYNWKHPEAAGKKDAGREKWLADNFMNFEQREAARKRQAEVNAMAHAKLSKDLGVVGDMYNMGSKSLQPLTGSGRRKRSRKKSKRKKRSRRR
tara:strand:+ start:178 stop:672 length:495 start_codon:yes stop_codon:yes gene_type:complete